MTIFCKTTTTTKNVFSFQNLVLEEEINQDLVTSIRGKVDSIEMINGLDISAANQRRNYIHIAYWLHKNIVHTVVP